jgi:hypothetical protein
MLMNIDRKIFLPRHLLQAARCKINNNVAFHVNRIKLHRNKYTMSWQPNWQGDAPGGFRRGRAGSEEGEEVEESSELKPPETARREDGEMEEDGEIPPVPVTSAPIRTASAGHVDFPSQFRGGRGPNNPRFGVGRDRPRQRSSFTAMPSPRIAPNGGGFSGGGNANGPPFQRDSIPALSPPPPNFRGGDRDVMDGQPPRGPGGRDYRDFGGGGPPSNGPGPRADGGPPFGGGRDFRNDPPAPPNRDFSDGPPNRPPPRDFRGSGPPPPGRDFRNDRDYRDRSDGPPLPNRDFRAGNQPPFARDRGNSLSLHREPSFGSGPREPPFRDGQPSFRDGPNRDGQFLDGPPRDFRDNGPRDPPFRDSMPPERGGFGNREMSGAGRDPNISRGGGMPFPPRGPLKRDTSHGGYNRDAPFDDGREDKPPLQRTSSTGMMPGGNMAGQPPSFSPSAPKNTIVQGAAPPHKLRPTDPRRRASVGSSPGAFGAKPDVPYSDPRRRASVGSSPGAKPDVPSSDPRHSTGPPLGVGGPSFNNAPASHPPRRLSSYSSLADGSSKSSSLAPKGPPQSGEGPGLGPNDHPGGSIRSPVPPVPPRRMSIDPSAQNESGEYYGPLGGGPHPQRHSSLNNERGRPPGNAPPNPSRAIQQQQPPISPSRLPQAISMRPSNIRSNDPRFRQQEKAQSEELGRSELGMPNAPQIGSSSMDTFGRSRDWKDRPFGARPGSSTPRSSPVKQKSIRTFSSSPQSEKPVSNLPSFPDKSKEASTTDVAAKPKPEPVLPLSTKLLRDDEVIKRAKAAMEHLSEVVHGQSKGTPGSDDESTLPTKQVIMSAVTEIEKLIKKLQKDSDALVEKKQSTLGDEENEREEEVKRLAEEKLMKKLDQERLAEEEKRKGETRRAAGLKEALEGNEDLFLKAKARLEKDFHESLSQAKDDERKRFIEEGEGQVSKAASSFDKDIAKAQRDLEKAKAAFQKVELKVSSAESEYQSLLRSEDEEGETKEPSTEPISTISKLIQSITSNNKRCSAEAKMFSFSLVSDSSWMNSETETSLQTATDPKYYRANEEWSDLAARVSSLDEALYSDPSEAPYFEHSEKRHSIFGPAVKEVVRDRQQRLLDQWTQLAEEYEVRKRLYEKQQKKLAKRGQQRGSISVAGRSSILGDKKTNESSGIDRGSNFLESTGRTSNNPYRRARRGNEVRSEYEQEQIIAEIAAKEAMEKRITHGGCKLPRQICRLERVSGLLSLMTYCAL